MTKVSGVEMPDVPTVDSDNDVDVVCICGSTRFADQHAIARWELERTGNYICLMINYLPEWYTENQGWDGLAHHGEAAGCKAELDDLHFRKIDMSDWVLVVNPDDYVGESTSNEIRYARDQGKPVRFLHPHNESAAEGEVHE